MPANQQTPISVLMVENDPTDVELCERRLNMAGFKARIDSVETPEGFRQKIETGKYDVILADYSLAGWTGLDAFDWSRRRGCDTPFILVTGALGDEGAVECIKRGISDYVRKDRLARLPIAVERAIEEKSRSEDRLRAERTAWEKERRFLSLIEHCADAVELLNSRGVVVFSSQAEQRILGYKPEERAGIDFFEPVDAEDASRAGCVFRRLSSRPGARKAFELRYRTKRGAQRWLECNFVNLLGEPTVQGIVVNYRDISDRKQAEEETKRLNEELEHRVEERTTQLEAANAVLQEEIAERKRAEQIIRESQERFRLVVDGVRDYAIYMLDPQGRVASWNAGAERIKGYRAEEIIGRHFSCFYAREDVERGRPAEDLRVAATEGRLEDERLNVRKDGSTFWASVILTALYDPPGALRGFCRVTRDITKQRQAYQALERLRLQQQLILDSAGDGIFGLDETGVCTFANPAGARMAERSSEELTGKPISDYFVESFREKRAHRREITAILAALRDGTACAVDNEVLLRADGSSLAVDYIVTPMRSKAGQILGAVVVFHDATARRAVEKMKDEFISVVSHELRTPLTAIRASLGLLASGRLCTDSGKCQAMVKVGVDNADHLVRLVSDILDLERIESGAVAIEKQACDSASLFARACELMRATAESRDITLEVDSGHLTLSADPDRMLQVLINLLSNAIKFSPPGSAVSMGADEAGSEVVFRVKDTGRGIPADKLSLVFERFQQVDAGDSREKGGTGLGLAICKSIVAEHDGRIWVESAPGQGSTFYFSIPSRAAPTSRDMRNSSE